MFDFSKIHSGPVDRDFVLKKVDDATIFCHYFGSFKIKEAYKSKFRKDKIASTGFYINRVGKVIYNDFRTGEKLDCFAYVAKLYNISYGEAIKRVARDFGLIDNTTCVVSNDTIRLGANLDKECKKETVIQFIPDKWTDAHLSFWREFEITKDELIRENVYPVKTLFINKNKIYNPKKYLRFAYIVENGDKSYVKIYSPSDPRMKWVSSIPLSIPFGMNSLPEKSDKLIITKSQKDRILLMKIFDAVIATQNESESALPSEILDNINLRDFKEKIIFWDNDETGVENCKKFNAKGFGYFNIPKEYYNKFRIKDASDFVAYYGLDALIELFKNKNIL
jgi:hypothetical protein